MNAEPQAAGPMEPLPTGPMEPLPTGPMEPLPGQQNAAAPTSITDNPNGEGIYRMHGPSGEVGVPYSKAKGVGKAQGYTFADDNEYSRFMKDYLADPHETQKMVKVANDDPALGWFLGAGKHALRSVLGISKIANDTFGTGATQGNSPVVQFANEPDQNINQKIGGGAEDVGEFIGGEKLLKYFPELTGSAKMKAVTQLTQLAEKHPLLAAILKPAAVGAGQTYMKTGGDTQAALESGAITGGLSTIIPGASAAAGAVRDIAATSGEAAAARTAATEAAAATTQKTATWNAAAINTAAQAERDAAAAAAAARPGAPAYAQEAQGAARPALEGVNEARKVPAQEIKMAQPGGGPGIPTGKYAQPEIDIDGTLARTHDFTGAADRLEEQGHGIYNEFDRVTDGGFRKLNGQVQKARMDMRSQVPGAAETYQASLDKMDQLMEGARGQLTPEQVDAGKALWTKQYALRDVGDILDKSINRVPGSTEPAGEGTNIDGKDMLKRLQRLVTVYKGRTRLDAILGPGRLETLEGIAQANTTEAKKQVFQTATTTVEDELVKMAKAEATAAKLKAAAEKKAGTGKVEQIAKGAGGRALAMSAGGALAHSVGAPWYWGMVTAEGVYEPSAYVWNALKTNPKIAKNFLFALESGATRARYGPLIANMIAQHYQSQPEEKQETQP